MHIVSFVYASLLTIGSMAVAAPGERPEIPPLILVPARKAFPQANRIKPDNAILQNADSAVKWQLSDTPLLEIADMPANWRGNWDTLEFRIFSENPFKSTIYVKIGFEVAQSGKNASVQLPIQLDFIGWHHSFLPFADAIAEKAPGGINQFTSISFEYKNTSTETSATSPLLFGQIQLIRKDTAVPPKNAVVASPKQQGPVTTDEEFFKNILNLEYPGMDEVRNAVMANDLKSAKSAFARYLRSRNAPVWDFDWRKIDPASIRHPQFIIREADEICNNRLSACRIACQFGEDIDWRANPTKQKYVEWTWQLSRHGCWPVLGQAYWATGDEKYARAFVRQIRSWIIDNPLPNDAHQGAYSRWRTIETGIRMMETWPEALLRFLGSPSLDDDSLVMIVKSMYEHGVHNRAFPQTHNWLCIEMNGLYHVATLFPEFKISAQWRDYAGQRLFEELESQVYPDGAQQELAPGYHVNTINDFVRVYNLAQLNNRTLPAGYIERLQKMFDMVQNVVTPLGELPAFNDSSWDSAKRSLILAKELFWKSNVKPYGEPCSNSVWMPWAGWSVMRNGNAPNSHYLIFDVGPLGAAHQHEDKLNFCIYAFGKRLLTEGQIYVYDTSKWREYVLSARAHNVVRIDGKDQSRRGAKEFYITDKKLPNRWISNDSYDFSEGWYNEGFGPERDVKVTHTRSILFVKPAGYWLVFDVMTPPEGDSAPHEYTSWFHFNSNSAELIPKLNGALSSSPNSPNLLIAPLFSKGLNLTIISGQEEPEVQGWVSQGINYKVSPVATPTFTRTASGQSVDAYIFMPFSSAETTPVSSIDNINGDVSISFTNGSRHVVHFVPNADGTARTITVKRTAPDGSTLSTISIP